MVRIKLDDERAEILREMMASSLSNLRMEIAYAQQKEFRDFLKKRLDLLEKFLQDLEKELGTNGRAIINIDRLRKVDILQGLSEWELRIVAQFFQEENCAEGTTLCVEGEKADRLFILEEGSVSRRLQRGQSYDIHTPWKVVGWSFLVPPNRYTATVVTLSASKLLVIKSPDFYYLIHKEPKIGVKIMANLAQVIAGRLSQLQSST
jgi:hypothetical protein